ncbi:MAG: serine/threonine-protein kinase [Haliangiales bacterium]
MVMNNSADGYHQKIESIFHAVREAEESARPALLDKLCGGDRALRDRVQELVEHGTDEPPEHLDPNRSPTARELRVAGSAGGTRPRRQAGRDVFSGGANTALSFALQATPAVQSATCLDSRNVIDISPGAKIGQYELIRSIGSGGMSIVYLARDTKLGRRVAVKFINIHDQHALREARATARCDHPNIVVIHDIDEHQRPPYIVLEYLKGQSLATLLQRSRQTHERSVELIIAVVRALVCAHANGIVHRDLKPDNVILTETGTIKVLDFGLAKPTSVALRRSSGATQSGTSQSTVIDLHRLSHAGQLVGTPPYMSPEQWLAADVDGRTDIWAVGLLLYELIVGHHPLAPLSEHSLKQIRAFEQPMPSAHHADIAMPAALADLIDKCLAKQPCDRFATARALLDELEALQLGHTSRRLGHAAHPYAGLASFQERDADRFFGRDYDIRAVVTQLDVQPLMALIGPSGIGKSSFARAGIVPRLKSSGIRWETHVIRPGRAPMDALASVLAPLVGDELDTPANDHDLRPIVRRRLRREPGYLGTVLRDRVRRRVAQDISPEKILLFIDQFEELYTLTADADERRAFIRCLLGMADDPTSPLRLVLAIRSDFLDRAAEDRDFISAVRDGGYFLTAPQRDGLRDALARPAEMSGYRFESTNMLEGMLDTLEASTNPLPLLQFTAAKLWDARDRTQRLLTEAAYEALGGIDGALASHADAVLTSLSPPEQAVARTLFLHLVTPERTRALTSTAELCQLANPPEAAQRVLDHLIQARLLVVHDNNEPGTHQRRVDRAQVADSAASATDRDSSAAHNSNGNRQHDDDNDSIDTDHRGASVEIVHESLIHSWPTLSHWIDEGQEDIAFLGQLRAAAKLWQRRGRPRGLLWRDDAMREAQRWRRRYQSELPALQREFLAATFTLATRTQRRRRLLVTGTIVFLSLLVVASAIALFAIAAAEQEARDAELAARAAEQQARAAEHKVREQLAVIQEKERARKAAIAKASAATETATVAEAKVEQSREELAKSNEQLRAALAEARAAEQLAKHASERAKQESQRAIAESERARQAADEAHAANNRAEKANAELSVALAREQAQRRIEQARIRELQALVGTVGSSLK